MLSCITFCAVYTNKTITLLGVFGEWYEAEEKGPSIGIWWDNYIF